MPERTTSTAARGRLANALLLFVSLAGTGGPGVAATLEPAELTSNEGYYQLTWEADEPVRLVESASAGFESAATLYTGSDTGHVISGKPDGTWYYRLESADGGTVLSETSTITVSHHPLGRAFLFFGIGAVVFFSTLGLILFARPGGDERAQ